MINPTKQPGSMSWGSSILTGVLTAIAGAVVAGIVATFAVGWYRISSFEAGAAAFTVGFIILGIVAGFITGLVTSRTFGAGAGATFLATLGVATGVVLGIGAVVGLGARLLADVPPTIDGEALMLAVELKWPEGHSASPATLPGEPSIQLGSVFGSTMRASSRGPLWPQDARLVDGRWVVPGAVDIFTTRGKFTIHAIIDSATVHAFLIPLRGRPAKKDMEWTDWYPQARRGGPPLPNGFSYRYRVQKRSEPVRTEAIGPFEVQTIANGFVSETIGDSTALATSGKFRIRHRGKTVTVENSISDSADAPGNSLAPTDGRLELADGVAVIGGHRPALLAHFTDPNTTTDVCYVLVDENEELRTVPVPRCNLATGSILTSDSAAFRNGGRHVVRGRINRVAFETPGIYAVGSSVLDTRQLSVHAYSLPDGFSVFPDVPPIGISPDARSVVFFGSSYDAGNQAAVAVTDFVGNRNYKLLVDEARMRYATLHDIDPAWLMHHFEWQRGIGGVDSLVERKSFVPIPYSGRFAMANHYWLEPAKPELRDAIIELLVNDFKGERVPVDAYAYQYPVKLGDKIVNVAYGETGDYVSVSLPDGVNDKELIETVARHIDRALATGKYDSLFGKR